MTFWTQLGRLPHELRYVDAGGVPTRTLIAGSGEPVIFLHGITGHLETYIPTLAAHAEHFQVHAIDMLGHGWTGRPDEDYTVQRLAQHVIDYLDAMDIPKAHIVGISQGGWTGAYLAAEHPERVERLTMVVPAGDPDLDPGIVERFLYKLTRESVFDDDPEGTRRRLAAVVADPASLTDELVEARYAIYQDADFRAHLENILASATVELYQRDALTPERLAKVTCETLVVWGSHDPAGRHGGDYLMAGLPNARLITFEHAGHWVPFEQPEAFSELDTAFLSKGLAAVPAPEPAH